MDITREARTVCFFNSRELWFCSGSQGPMLSPTWIVDKNVDFVTL